jgi:hypothetical protein
MEQSSSTNRAINVLRKVTSMVLLRPRKPNDFKFASDEDIQALRTMITMLTAIQKTGQPIKSLPAELVPSPHRTDSQRKELKVLSALATVLVMEHEVVAVVAKNGIGPGGVEEVVACTDSIVDKESDSEPPKSLLENFIATYNPRKVDKSKTKLAIHNQSYDFQNLTKEELLDKFKAGTKKEKNKL